MFCTLATHITHSTHTHLHTRTYKHLYAYIGETVPQVTWHFTAIHPGRQPQPRCRGPRAASFICQILAKWRSVCGFSPWARIKNAVVSSPCIHTHDQCYISSSNCLQMLTATRVHVADCQRLSLSTRPGGWWILEHLCYTSID